MPEPHLAAELGQPRLRRRRPRLDRDAQPPGRAPYQRPVTGRIGGRQLQQPPGLVRHGVQLAPEAVLDPARQRRGAGQAEPAGQLRGGQPTRQFQQRQRVAAGLGDDQVADSRVQPPGQRRVQQHPRVIVVQPVNFQLRQPGQIGARIAGREHQPDRVGGEPPRGEPERLCRGLVQPLLVVDQADQRAFPGHPGQQAHTASRLIRISAPMRPRPAATSTSGATRGSRRSRPRPGMYRRHGHQPPARRSRRHRLNRSVTWSERTGQDLQNARQRSLPAWFNRR